MRLMHDIFRDISEGNKCSFCWGIHIITEAHGEAFNTIYYLDSDVNYITNPVIEGNPMLVFKLF